MLGGWLAVTRGTRAPGEFPVGASPSAAVVPDATGRTRPADDPVRDVVVLEPSGRAALRGAPTAPGAERVAPPATACFVSGVVTRADTGLPVEEFAASVIRARASGAPLGAYAHAELRDARGRFSFAVDEPGHFRLFVRAAAFRGFLSEPFELPDPGTDGPGREFDVRLDPGLAVTGRVVADATGAPVAGAIVGTTRGMERLQLQRLQDGERQVTIHAFTDADGAFTLSGLVGEEQRLVASHPDFAMGDALATPGAGDEVELRLPAGAAIHGVVRGDDGRLLAGALVRAFPDGCAMGRSATTDEAGAYRLLPCPPGPVDVVASPPAKQTEETFPLTTEVQRVLLADDDLRVDFGPSPLHATWCGTVHDYDGSVLPGALVVAVDAAAPTLDRNAPSRERRARCDDAGAFELGKLLTGATYRVEVRLDHDATAVPWEDLRIEGPGLLERDVHLGGTLLAGRVVDRATGERPEGRGSVFAYGNDMPRTQRDDELDEAGRFVLRDLAPGVYDVFVSTEGRPTVTLHGVEVAAGEARSDLLIEVGGGGALRLVVEGFDQADRPLVHFGLTHESGPRQEFRGRYDETGRIDVRRTLEPGLWSLHVAFTGRGTLVREVEVLPGETTEVRLGPADVVPLGDPVTVAGHLRRADGRPVADALVFVYGLDAPQESAMERRFRHAATDADGGFAIDGLLPGRWSVRARLSGGGEPEFADLLVPPRPRDPVPLELALPGGQIRGNLLDAATGADFTDESPTWWVFLHDLDAGGLATELNGGHTGRTFELVGVPAGRYRLEVRAGGYRTWTGPELRLEEGQELDVGALELGRPATLVLAVVDEAGAPLEGCSLTVDGVGLWARLVESDAPGAYRVRQLDPGARRVLVRADGFQPAELDVQLHAGAATEERVRLRRE